MEGGLSFPPAPGLLTADDIIRAGACNSGVGKRLRQVAETGTVAAAEPASRMLTLVPKEERQYILDAVSAKTLPGDGATQSYGYGDGDGDGYGYGYGDGYGDGDGDGYGDGYG